MINMPKNCFYTVKSQCIREIFKVVMVAHGIRCGIKWRKKTGEKLFSTVYLSTGNTPHHDKT